MEDAHYLNITTYCLDPNLQKHPDKIALILVDEIGKDQRFSFQDIYTSVCKLTAGLKSLHLPAGSVVTIRAPIGYDFLILFLAVMAADLVAITLLLAQTQEEVDFILKDSHTHVFFQLGKNKLNCTLPENCKQITEDEFALLKNFPATPVNPTTKYHDPAYIFYTSGSTALPKGVLHAQRAIIGRKPSRDYWFGLNEKDVMMHTDKICWTYSMLTGFLDPLCVGATTLIFTGYNSSPEIETPPETWLKLIDFYQVTVVASSPDFFHAVLALDDLASYPVSSLRLVASAGAPLPEKTQEQWLAHFSFPIFSALGMTELSTFISTGPSIPIRKNKIGKIQPGRHVAILPLDKGIEPVPVNTEGMLAIHKSEPGLMLGYLGQTNKNNPAYRGDWFLTQDIVSMDEEGYITYYGRADNLLKVSTAFRVSPIEIEQIIMTLPNVENVACGAYFDEETGVDQLIAYIVSPTPTIECAKAIYHELTARLIDYKIPYVIAFVSKLPHNQRGKLDRHQLNKLRPLLRYFK